MHRSSYQARRFHALRIRRKPLKETLRLGIEKAASWRIRNIQSHTDTYRVHSGRSDGTDGLFIDRFGDLIAAASYDPAMAHRSPEIMVSLAGLFPGCRIIVKTRQNAAANEYSYAHNEAWREDGVSCCMERGLKFEVRADPRHDYGLYTDTKAARALVSEISGNKKILNLFSYTCAFAVAACAGGAADAVNIDPSKEYLDWGGRNAALNGMIFKRYVDTTQDYLSRHLRRLEAGKDSPFDLTIVDPPAFLVGRGTERLARKLWPDWLSLLGRCGCPEFLIVFNDKSAMDPSSITRLVRDGLGPDAAIEAIGQSPDVRGQELGIDADPFYLNPLAYHVRLF